VLGASTLIVKVLSKKSIFTKGQTMKSQSGFTLVEILIVVVILGILAAIVIPQFTEASTEAKTSSLVTDLQAIRSQIQLFKAQHNDNLPGVGPIGTFTGAATFKECLELKTDIFGNPYPLTDTVSATGGPLYGPYMNKLPTNQFVDSDVVTCAPIAGATPAVDISGNQGWYFDEDTGKVWATSSLTHLTY
jgi:general secretion pathway protein G